MARERGVPAYVVLHDATLEGIATSRPQTLSELRAVSGIGDKKLERYGDALLALVNAAAR
jgi:ATP-dependent DNA helicase RecQ